MKSFKLLAIAAILAFITAGVSAQAPVQNTQDPQQIAQKATEQIKQNVSGISPEQESKILSVELNYTKSVQNVLNTTGSGDKAAIHGKIQPLRENRDTKIKTILSAGQYAQYEKSKPEYQG